MRRPGTADARNILRGLTAHRQLRRYAAVTVAGYGVLYAGTYFLVEQGGVRPRSAYLLLLTLVYAGVYVSYSTFVFDDAPTQRTLGRFLAALILTWVLNNAFFYLLNDRLGIHYLAVITLNIVLFGALRFCVQRFYVFKAP